MAGPYSAPPYFQLTAGHPLLRHLVVAGVVVVTLCLFCAILFSQDDKDRHGEASARPAAENVRDILGAEKFRIFELIAVISDEAVTKLHKQAVCNAIVELGTSKAIEASRPIAERLDLQAPRKRADELPSHKEMFPAVGALIDIGETCIPAIFDAVACCDRTEDFRLNAVYTIMQIKGGPVSARKTVEEALKENAKRSGRLQALMDAIPEPK